MKTVNEKRVLRKRSSLSTLQTCKDAAKLIEELLSKQELDNGGKEAIHKIFLRYLDELEYFLMMDEDGLAIIHTNRLREGMTFLDEVAKKAISAQEAVLQVYYRNTGEVLVDAACPINLNGKRCYTLRAGLIVQEKHIWLQNFSMQLIPILGAVLPLYIITRSPQLALTSTIIGVGLAAITAYIKASRQKQAYVNLQLGMQKIGQGDLTLYQQPKGRDELGQLTFEVNKISMGLKTLLKDLAEISTHVSLAAIEQKGATDEVSQGTENIAATIEEVTASSQEQVAAVQQVASFIKKITESINGIEAGVKETLESSKYGVEKMQEGNKAIESSMMQMKKIDESFTTTSEVIQDLADKSDQIGEIIHAITGIAEQTNLLALNAAIEAARAGENGRGFAVVADEVRKLAEESNRAAQEIMTIISETQEKTKKAVETIYSGSQEVQKGSKVIDITGKMMKETMTILKHTTDQMTSNSQLIAELNESGKLLEADTDMITEISQATSIAMQDISATIQQQTVMSEQIANSSSELADAANHLDELIKRFKLE